VSESQYNALGNIVQSTRFAQRPTIAAFTESALIAAVEPLRNDVENQIKRFAYDAEKRLRFVVDAQNSVTENAYDANANLLATTRFAKRPSLAQYDESAIAAAVAPLQTEPENRATRFAYDALNRLRFTVAALGSVSERVYDALGQLLQRVNYANPVTLTQFDLASVENALVQDLSNDRITTYVLDSAGRQRFEIRPDLSLLESQYDAFDQLTQTALFDLKLSTNVPHSEVELVSLRGSRAVGDGVTRGQVHAWDKAGRLISTIDASGNTESYEYDALGNRTRWIDKDGNVWTSTYDVKGRKIRETSPPFKFNLNGEDLSLPAADRVIETHYAYDAFDNLIQKVEAANFANDSGTTDFLFDSLGRSTVTLYHGYYDENTGAVERDQTVDRFRRESDITYDALGNSVRVSIRTSLHAFQHTYQTFDSQGRVVHEVNALNHVTRYTYNSFGEPETVTRYSVTISGAPQNAQYWTIGEIDSQLNLGHDENGNPIEDTLARTTRLAYDKQGRKSVVTMPTATFYSTHTPGDASHDNYHRPNPESVVPVQDAPVTLYEYNSFGDITRQLVRINNIIEWQTTWLTYDTMGREVSVVDTHGQVTNTFYDVFGNLFRQEEITGLQDGSDRISEYRYNTLDQQIAVVRYGLWYTDAEGIEHGVAYFNFDQGGWVDPDANIGTTVRTANYDAYGRALSFSDAAGNQTSMRYNAFGQLIEVIAPVRVTAPLAANGEEAVDPFHNQVSDVLVTTMTLDPYGRNMRLVNATLQGGDAREIQQLYDAAGNLIISTDAEGNAKRRSYDPAGRVIAEEHRIHSDLGLLGTNNQGLDRRYTYDALGQLTQTLDFYLEGTQTKRSGKAVVYNSFGEVVEESRKWGLEGELTAKVASYAYDNAGHISEKQAADGRTLYFYNLLGQVTREERLGNNSTEKRVTEHQYDLLGRETMVRRPAFDADVAVGLEVVTRLVTPYLSRSLDRWGNVLNTQEGGYWLLNGQPSPALKPVMRGYEYDDNNRVLRESFGFHALVTARGVEINALITKKTFRDLLGNVVKEVDEAHEPHLEAPISSRTRRRIYDSVGRLIAEIDATDRKVEYAYNIHGEKMGTRNARGTVFFNRRDRNGSALFRGVLRKPGVGENVEYNSQGESGPIVRTYLAAHLYDQANRRFASKTFTDGGDAPWAYTWLDGRNLAIKQHTAMGFVTEYNFDPFGNKAVETDALGVRSEWNAATADYVVGRIDNYRLPAGDNVFTSFFLTDFGQYLYNGFGEVERQTIGNGLTVYSRHKNGLVHQLIVTPHVGDHQRREITTYEYNARGQLTREIRNDVEPQGWSQTKTISYDDHARLLQVEQDRFVSGGNGGTCGVKYAYDEWGNVRHIKGTFINFVTGEPEDRESWYEYDHAGRLTISNGDLQDGKIDLKSGGALIEYDGVGRRSFATHYVRRNINPLQGLTSDTIHDENYTYDDLGHLRQTKQRISNIHIIDSNGGEGGGPVSLPEEIGEWRNLSTRKVNLRGEVTKAQQWKRMFGGIHETPAFLGTTTTEYRSDGQVIWTETVTPNPNHNTRIVYLYSEEIGLMKSYVFDGVRADSQPFNTTFRYDYSYQNGVRVVRQITDTTNALHTTKTFDPLGRLTDDHIELPVPDFHENRFFEYGADGRVIFKRVKLTSSNPTGPTSGHQTYVYAANRIVATVSAERLSGATKFDFAYTKMSEAAGGGNTSYVVRGGDSLIDIAQACYGDGALWSAIADANSVAGENPNDPLPNAEVGKAYEIPDVVRSSHSSSTIASYSLAKMIGNDRPLHIPPPPPPPSPSGLEVLFVAAASIAIQVGATVGLTLLGVPAPLSYGIAAGLSNVGAQATSWGLGMQPGQDGIDWGGAAVAAFEVGAFSIAGPIGPVGREFWQQAKGNFEGWTGGPGLNWTGITDSLFNVGSNRFGSTLGGLEFGGIKFGVAPLINSALNPKSGWAVGGGSTGIGAFNYVAGQIGASLISKAEDWKRSQLKHQRQSTQRRSTQRSPYMLKWSVQSAQYGADAATGAAVSDTTILYDDKNHPPDNEVIAGVVYHPVWDARREMWDMQDDNGLGLYIIMSASNSPREEDTQPRKSWTLEEYKKERDGYWDYSDGKARFVPPTRCVYDVVFENLEKKQKEWGQEFSPHVTSVGVYRGGNPYNPNDSYAAVTRPQLDAAYTQREIQARLANIEANRNAGPFGILGGLVGALGSWLGGRTAGEGYASGLEIGSVVDTFVNPKNVVNSRNPKAGARSRSMIDVSSGPIPRAPVPHVAPSKPVSPAAPRVYHIPDTTHGTTYEALPYGGRDALKIGGDLEPRLRSVANITDGSGGFTGGSILRPPVLHKAPVRHGFEQFGSRIFADRVKGYLDAVYSNRKWSWDSIGLGHLDSVEREVVKWRAMEAGLLPRISNDPHTFHADFTRVLIEERVLPERLWLSTDREQFRYLDDLIGGRPAGSTWHHHEFPGWMQLVPSGIHGITWHLGGRSPGEWAYTSR
jgi:YD repeat-containing protein